MPDRSFTHPLNELVMDVIRTDDPTLCDRACRVLDALLADYADDN